MVALNRHDFKVLAYLRHSAFVRDGADWRFGLTRVSDSLVQRLVLTGHCSHLFPGLDGECIVAGVR